MDHAWHIEQREIDRQISRRGTRHAWESLDQLGHRVVLVADACAARRDQDHNAALYTTYRTFGDVRPTAEVLGLFAQPAPQELTLPR